MGLQLLKDKFELISRNHPKIAKAGGWSISGLLCLEEFLQMLALEGLIQPFKNMLLGIIATGSLLIGSLKLTVSSLAVASKLAEQVVGSLTSLIDSASSIADKIPFLHPSFTTCPPIQKFKAMLKLPKFFKGVESLMPASVKTFYKKVKAAPDTIREYELQILHYAKIIKDIEKDIEELLALLELAAAVVQSIDLQFPSGGGSPNENPPTFIS